MTRNCSLSKGVPLLLATLLLLLLLPVHHGRLDADQTDWISQAQERLRKGDREGALKALQQAAWQRPQEPAIHYNMGALAQSLGRKGEAVGHYMAYLRWAPEAADRDTVRKRVFQLCGELAAQAYRNRRYLQALDWYDKARELYPYAKTVHLNLSRVYEARGEWDRAAASLKEYHTLCGPADRGPVKRRIADYLRKAAETRFRDGDYDGSLVRYQEAARWDTEDAGLLLHQALCEERLGLLEDAKNHYLAYLQASPATKQREAIVERVIHLHVLLAEDYLRRGYLARAGDILGKGLEIDPDNRDFLYLLAKTALGLGRQEEAVAYLERILELSPDPAGDSPYAGELVDLCLSMADEAYGKGAYEDALRFLQKALYWAPENSLVAYNLARVYEKEEQWEQAILAYRRYLYLDPDAAERNEVKAKLAYYYSFLGTERFGRGEYPQAQEAFEQALLLSPEDEALLYNLATVLLKRGKTAESLHFLERYLKYERDPEEIERVQRQMTLLASRAEQKNRRKRGKSVSSGVASMKEEKGRREDSALDDRRRGYLLLQAGRWEEALDAYERCLSRVPGVGKEEAFQKEMASAYREVSREAIVRGDMAKALRTLERAREWAPAQAFPYLWQGKVYEHKGDVEAALQVYRESLRNVRGEAGRQAIRNRIVAILTQRLQVALRQEELGNALGAMEDLEPYLGESQARDVHYQRARIEGAMGLREEALADYGLHVLKASQVLYDPRIQGEISSLIKDDPALLATLNAPSNAYSKGREAASRGEHGKALFCYLVARSDEGAPTDLDGEILRSLESLRRGSEALTLLSSPSEESKALHLSEEQAKRLARKAESVLLDDYRTGHFERGLERIRGLQAQLPEPDRRLSLLQGVFEEMVGSYQNAIHRYEQVLRRPGTVPSGEASPVRHRLCTLLIRQALDEYNEGEYDACLESLLRADRTVPGRADVAFNLGCVYLRLKNPDGALQAFSRYLEIALEDSPRKQLTGNAILLLQRQLARSPVVRYDGQGIAVDLIFERPVSLGHLLSEGEKGEGSDALLDSVVLAPYLEAPLGAKELEAPLPF
jgi:tetratricopeptide (TPR) repeat protein